MSAGIEFKMGQKVTGTSDAGGGKLTLSYEAVKDGKAGEISADIVLVATGRRPVTGACLLLPSCHSQRAYLATTASVRDAGQLVDTSKLHVLWNGSCGLCQAWALQAW